MCAAILTFICTTSLVFKGRNFGHIISGVSGDFNFWTREYERVVRMRSYTSRHMHFENTDNCISFWKITSSSMLQEYTLRIESFSLIVIHFQTTPNAKPNTSACLD